MDRDIEYVLSVVGCGSITQAAKSLYITQPSLSRFITQLENKLGVQLFKRNANGITLTEAGEVYVSYAKEISTLYTSLEASLERLKNEDDSKIIRIAFLNTLYLSVWTIQKFLQEKYPDYRIEIMCSMSKDLQKFLDENQCDLVFGPDVCDHNRYSFTPLISDDILLAVPTRYNLEELAIEREGLSLKLIDISAIKDLDFIFPDKICNTRVQIDQLLSKIGVEIVPQQEFPSTPLTIKAAEDQQGCCFLAGGFAEDYITRPENLRFYLVGNEGCPKATLGITQGKNHKLIKQESYCITGIKRFLFAKRSETRQKFQTV